MIRRRSCAESEKRFWAFSKAAPSPSFHSSLSVMSKVDDHRTYPKAKCGDPESSTPPVMPPQKTNARNEFHLSPVRDR